MNISIKKLYNDQQIYLLLFNTSISPYSYSSQVVDNQKRDKIQLQSVFLSIKRKNNKTS